MNYFEFTKRFPDENSAIDFIVSTKYKDGYVCPKCGCTHKVYHQKYNRRFMYCNNCKSEFSALKGTIFENTHLDIRMWLYAMNLVLVSRKGISALQLKRELGMGSYQSAWRMLHQIRKAMTNEEYKETFEAIVEIDETYVGGKPRKENRHDDNDKDDENKSKRGRGTSKTPVIGVKERNTGKVHAVVANYNEEGKQLSGKQLFAVLKKVCKGNNTVMTDQFSGYNILDKESECNFVRLKVDHTVAFSLGNGIHTNGIESFWAVLKRGIYGIFHNVSVKYMQRYVDEFCFRLNHRDNNEAFASLVKFAVA